MADDHDDNRDDDMPTADPLILGRPRRPGEPPPVDYMVAVDRTTGKALNAWKGARKRLAFDSPNVIQYHVGRVKSAVSARLHGEMMFRSNRPGV